MKVICYFDNSHKDPNREWVPGETRCTYDFAAPPQVGHTVAFPAHGRFAVHHGAWTVVQVMWAPGDGTDQMTPCVTLRPLPLGGAQ